MLKKFIDSDFRKVISALGAMLFLGYATYQFLNVFVSPTLHNSWYYIQVCEEIAKQPYARDYKSDYYCGEAWKK